MESNKELLLASFSALAAVLYLYTAWKQLLRLEIEASTHSNDVLIPASLAVLVHAGTIGLSHFNSNVSLGFYQVASIIFLAMGSISLVLLTWRAIHTLLIGIFPLAAISLLVATFAPETGRPLIGAPPGLLIHISTSLIGYALFALASLQGVVVAQQSRLLRQHRTKGLVKRLPPLERTEAMMYELAAAGLVMLTVAIALGFIYVDDLLAQHLVHKTILTMIGWIGYGVLVFVHWKGGWRINTSVMLGFSAFACLTIGFFGSKLVLELLLA